MSTLHGIAGAARTLFDPADVPAGFACAPPGPFAERAQVVDQRALIPDSLGDADAGEVVTTVEGRSASASPNPRPATGDGSSTSARPIRLHPRSCLVPDRPRSARRRS